MNLCYHFSIIKRNNLVETKAALKDINFHYENELSTKKNCAFRHSDLTVIISIYENFTINLK